MCFIFPGIRIHGRLAKIHELFQFSCHFPLLSKQFPKSDLYVMPVPSERENRQKTQNFHFFFLKILIFLIILEENIEQPSRYRKEIRSPRESGKLYWSVKTIENRRREDAGLPKLPSMRHSNLEQQLIDRHEGKKKNPVIAIREKNYQIQKHTKGFATITPMRTKSGKSFSEVMANVRKKNVG